ncbi:MAG: hypothetical protein WC453_02200 [Patescibacteria group bacterium]
MKIKKLIIIEAVVMTLMLSLPILGQSFQDRLNVVAFGGYYAKQQNTNANGHNEGVYVDGLPFKSSNGVWTAGLYGSASISSFRDNISRYDGNIKEYGGGITVGYYKADLSAKYQLFVGASAGVKYSDDQGSSSSRWGEYVGRQKDWLMATTINLNLLSNAAILPRTQVVVSFQKPFKSEKTASWNDATIPSDVWDKTYVEIIGRQSIINAKIGELFLSPKLTALYSFSKGNKESKYAVGGELALHRPYKDDFLSLYCYYKMSNITDNQEFSFGLNLNIATFIH